MNILVLNYEYPPLGGGAAPVSRDISRQLVKAGNRVDVVTMGFEDLPSKFDDEGVCVYGVKCWRSKKSSCMPWEQLTYIISAKRFLKKLLKENQYDVCHTHFVIPTGPVAKWLKKKYHIPYIITAHGSDVEGYNSKKYMKIMHVLLRPFWKSIVNYAYKVVSPSEFLKGLMTKAYKVDDKYPIIPNGMDVAIYNELAEENQKERKILLMGRMQNSKNFQMAIEALSRIDLRDWTVDILGDGPIRFELEELVESKGLSDKMTFRGWVENKSNEQLEYLKHASIYISASKFENCPMAVLETACAGCFNILSDIPAHRQMIEDDCHYFSLDDVNQLAKMIEERIKIGNEVCKYDTYRYSWDSVMPKYIELLERAE